MPSTRIVVTLAIELTVISKMIKKQSEIRSAQKRRDNWLASKKKQQVKKQRVEQMAYT